MARSMTLEDLTSGMWLAPLVDNVLEAYSRRVDAGYFRRKYGRASSEEIIEQRISRAQRHAAIEGALSAGAATAAVAAMFATGGTATLVALPTGVVIFATDLLFTTRLQLQLAYDISVLYGHPMDLDDVEEMRDLLRIAFGERPEEGVEGVEEEDDDDAWQAMRGLANDTVRMSRKMISKMGRRLLRRALIKLTLPAASIPLSAAMNYHATGKVARRGRQIMRDRATARELAPSLAEASAAEPRLLLEAMWLVVNANRAAGVEESWLLEAVADVIRDTEAGDLVDEAMRELARSDPEQILERISLANRETREAIFDAVWHAATIDHELDRRERRMLKRLAKACSVPFDSAKIDAWKESESRR